MDLTQRAGAGLTALARLQSDRGLSDRAVARQLGVSRVTVMRWRRGTRPTRLALRAIEDLDRVVPPPCD